MLIKRSVEVDIADVKRTTHDQEFIEVDLVFEVGWPCAGEIRVDHVYGGVGHVNVLPGAMEIMKFGRLKWHRDMEMSNGEKDMRKNRKWQRKKDQDWKRIVYREITDMIRISDQLYDIANG